MCARYGNYSVFYLYQVPGVNGAVGRVWYSLQGIGNSAQMFRINPDTGAVTVIGNIAADNTDRYATSVCQNYQQVSG